MKKLLLLLAVLLCGTISMSAQSTETGYVTVYWDDQCTNDCCSPMVYGACITIERASDHAVIIQDLCATESQGDHHTFQFDFPCSSESEEFIVYATVRKGCLDPKTECCFGRNTGQTTTCEELMNDECDIDPPIVIN